MAENIALGFSDKNMSEKQLSFEIFKREIMGYLVVGIGIKSDHSSTAIILKPVPFVNIPQIPPVVIIAADQDAMTGATPVGSTILARGRAYIRGVNCPVIVYRA